MSNHSALAILDRFRGLPDFPSFEAFASSLWRNEAAVMVGAGFSRVCTRDRSSPIPPLWRDFRIEMAAALGYGKGEEPDNLRLAQEYQTLHGDSGLDQLIGRLVADDQWEPGPLHKQFMELPWRDVLTTNWDTLLERTKPQTPDRIYSCVRTIQDIAHRAQPRIVKLHGSLPSHKPFVFTEDDYRAYPVQFAPFVNLAQQIMLEHDLCLIGFSGSDPNFLAWSGWVRDTLNVSARRIRLVGVLNLSPVSRALLQKRNITPIDLAPLVKNLHREEQHEKALKLFFDALLASKPPSPYAWNLNSGRLAQSSVAKEEDRPSLMEVAEEWAKEKSRYPGWIICPSAERHRLRGRFVTVKENSGSAEARLRFALESVWRHRTARIWLNYQDMQEADAHYESAEQCLTKKEKSELCVSIAAEWRRYQKWDEWSRWMARLGKVVSNEATLSYTYEKALRALLDWDDEAVSDAAKALTSNEPIWIMRRAGLLAILCRYREAAELYQAALLSIRQKLLLSPKSAWLISLEGWADLFYQASYSILKGEFASFPENESDETRMRYFLAKADPWDTISYIERLVSERIDRNKKDAEKWRLSFKSGRYLSGRTTRISNDGECPFYGLLDLMETTGSPDSIGTSNLFSTRMEAAYRAIEKHDENDILPFFSRYRGADKKILEWMMSRMEVARLSDFFVQHLVSVIPKRIDRLAKYRENLGSKNYLVFLLELLARVVVRTTSKQAMDIFEWVMSLLDSQALWWASYSACGMVMESAVEALRTDDRQKAMMLALHFKTSVGPDSDVAERYWPEIFDDFSDADMRRVNLSANDVIQINLLISLVKDGGGIDRSRALRRLHVLYNADQLTVDQVNALDTAVWTRCGKDGWPIDTLLQPWVFLELPGSSRAEALFLEKIVGGVAGGLVEPELLANLRIGLNKITLNVSQKLLVSCVTKCLAWMPVAEDKNSISYVLSGIAERDKATGHEIGEVLARSLLPRLSTEDLPEAVAEQLRYFEEMTHIPSLAATAFQVLRLWPDHRPRVFAQIRSAIASRDPNSVYFAYVAVNQFIENASTESELPREVKELLLHACEQRTQPGLSSTLELLEKMVKKNLLTGEELDRLSSALPHVLKEYRYDQTNLEVPSKAELPTVRKEIHRLSKFLLDYCPELEKLKLELENDPLPEVRFID